MLYKIVTYGDWLTTYRTRYPYARSDAAKTEVVLSCRYGEGNLTQEEALAHIDEHWIEEGVIG